MKKFEVKNLDYYFDEKILRRGYDNYKRGVVKSAKYYSNYVHLEVKGTVVYDCLITFKNDDKMEMECNCPYDENCKHLATALFYLKNNEIEEGLKYNKNSKLDEFSMYEIKVKGELNSLLFQYNGFFDWKNGHVFVNFISEKTNELKNNLNDPNIGKKIVFLYKLVNEAEYVDGSDGEHGSALYDINEVLNEIISFDFSKFTNVMKLILETDFPNYFFSKEDIIEDLEFNPKNISDSNFLDYLVDLNKSYKTPKLSLKIIKLLDSTKREEESLELALKIIKEEYNPCRNHNRYTYEEIIAYYLNKLEIKKEYQKLADILDYLITLINNSGIRFISNKEYYNKYLKVLKKLDLNDLYQQKLLEFYKKYPDINKFFKLKKIFNLDKTNSLYYELLNDALVSDLDSYATICLEENLIDELFNGLKNNVYVLTRYLEYLDKYKDEIINIYIDYYKGISDRARTRGNYQDVMTDLGRIKKYKISEEVYPVIINYIKENFKSRPAFQDELEYFINKL